MCICTEACVNLGSRALISMRIDGSSSVAVDGHELLERLRPSHKKHAHAVWLVLEFWNADSSTAVSYSILESLSAKQVIPKKNYIPASASQAQPAQAFGSPCSQHFTECRVLEEPDEDEIFVRNLDVTAITPKRGSARISPRLHHQLPVKFLAVQPADLIS